jgi:hypothetical protein
MSHTHDGINFHTSHSHSLPDHGHTHEQYTNAGNLSPSSPPRH